MDDSSSRVTSLNMLSVSEIVAGIRRGRFSAEEVTRACLDRIGARDDVIHAWAALDAEAALRAAHVGPSGPLAGVPFAVKDVIDTASLPTRMGSQIYDGHRPRVDAGTVAQLCLAGAVLLGKTVTQAFAGTQPVETVNPHDPGRTSGGSSSGSAAAVADHMVPFALGTQTGGSVLRPAAYCGVVGFKPTFGFYTPAGVKVAAHSFDTVGLIARSVRDVALVHAVLMNDPPVEKRMVPPRIGLFRSHLWDTVEPSAQNAVEQAADTLRKAGASVAEVSHPPGFETITEQRAVINAFERARALAGEWKDHRTGLDPHSLSVSERGTAVTGERYVAARRMVEDFRAATDSLVAEVDFLLTPTTSGPAPRGNDYAGDPRLQELWTMLHLPSLSLPAPRRDGELPLGLQLVGRRFDDRSLIAAAAWTAQALSA